MRLSTVVRLMPTVVATGFFSILIVVWIKIVIVVHLVVNVEVLFAPIVRPDLVLDRWRSVRRTQCRRRRR